MNTLLNRVTTAVVLLGVIFSAKLHISVPGSTSGQMLSVNTISKTTKTNSKTNCIYVYKYHFNGNAQNICGDYDMCCDDIPEQTMNHVAELVPGDTDAHVFVMAS